VSAGVPVVGTGAGADTGTSVCVGGVVEGGGGAGGTGTGVEEGVIAGVIVAAIAVGDATFGVWASDTGCSGTLSAGEV
jgi:hypothetical protein